MRLFRYLAVGALLVASGCAPEEKAATQQDAVHSEHQAASVAHSQHQVSKDGLKATFHITAPSQPAYTCPMHPEVVSDTPGTCPACKMELQKQTHQVAVEVADAKGQPVKDAAVRLAIKDSTNRLQGLNVKQDGNYQGAFHLAPGQQQITAFVKAKDAAQAVALSVPYEVK